MGHFRTFSIAQNSGGRDVPNWEGDTNGVGNNKDNLKSISRKFDVKEGTLKKMQRLTKKWALDIDKSIEIIYD